MHPLIFLILLPTAMSQILFPGAQQALLARGFSQDQIQDARERFSSLSAGLSPEARAAEQQMIAIARDSSTPPFEKRARLMQFMSTLSPSARAELRAMRQQIAPGFGGLMG